MRQETTDRSESFQRAMQGLEELERHLRPDYTGARKKPRTQEEGDSVTRHEREATRKLVFLSRFKESLQTGQTVGLEDVFTMYFRMLITPDYQYDADKLQTFMTDLIAAAKESGAFYVRSNESNTSVVDTRKAIEGVDI